MTYFFITGRHPELSQAEIAAVFPLGQREMAKNGVLFMETDEEINCEETIKRLGGTIKIGTILKETDKKNILKDCLEVLDKETKSFSGKFFFGFSNYTNHILDFKKIGMTIKTVLKEKGLSARWVVSKEKILSSVIVEQNHLLTKGIEINIIDKNGILFLGKTLSVQPFKELSYRDYGRPERDDASGMLPPKLAQIMLNLSLAKKNEKILDPFCGSGTIISEAILIGYQNILGSDISEKAVFDTRKNAEWIQQKFKTGEVNVDVDFVSALDLEKKIKPHTISAIITEPYLGPQRGSHDISKTIKDLEKLYDESLAVFRKIIKPGGKVVMIWPVFVTTENSQKKFRHINPEHQDWTMAGPNNTRRTWLYGREGQKVYREIVILE
jgi:tRNA (guanine10-N2)-dimethyltransferase